jgi:polysaccharide biosynthesis/export protein
MADTACQTIRPERSGSDYPARPIEEEPMIFATWKKVATGCVVAVSLAACQNTGSSAPLETQTASVGEYKLGAGDEIRVTVFGQEQLSGPLRVDGAGYVAMPLVGEIEAKGKTARELEMAIAQKLNEGYVRDARVSAEVVTFRPFYIIGEVTKPGQYPYVNGMTATTAVAMAGGYTYRGRQDYILVTRGADPEKVERRAPTNTQVLPDDVVRIPERFF